MKKQLCVGPECDRFGRPGSGLCIAHYNQKYRTGELWPIGVPRDRPKVLRYCEIENCQRPNYAYGLCSGHNSRKLRGYKMDVPFQGTEAMWSNSCIVTNCGKPTSFRFEVCKDHRATARKYGMTLDVFVDFYRPGCCAACGATKDLNVHHDHACCATEKTCGNCAVALLCGPCNRAAGMVGDSPARLRRIAELLEVSSANRNSARPGSQ